MVLEQHRLPRRSKSPFLPCHQAHIAGVAALVNNAILDRLANRAALFLNVHAVRVDALAQVGTKFHKASGQVFRRNIPRRQRANTC